MTGLESRTVDWWLVHQFVVPLLDQVGSWPLAGSLPWQHLDDDDPIKQAALYDAAQHHALRIDTAQAAMAEASREISTAADWSGVARKAVQRNGIYIPRRVA